MRARNSYFVIDNKLTVRENLRHGGRLYGLSGPSLAKRIDEMLGHYRLAARAGDLCGALSGGLRRLAKSLLHEPDVILLDEPSTGLDPAARQDLWERLTTLKAGGAVILINPVSYAVTGLQRALLPAVVAEGAASMNACLLILAGFAAAMTAACVFVASRRDAR